jgi:hypothetical protein
MEDLNQETLDATPPEESEKSIARRLRAEREKAELLKNLKAEDFSTLKARVAAVLNLYPAARDSDIVLCLRYWETFQPDIYDEKAIAPSDLFKLERLHYIVRARAMIQNEYGLFVASEKVRGHRKKNEETVKAEILAEEPGRSVVRVYADETGKNGKFVMVAAVWALSGRGSFKVRSAIENWRSTSSFAHREVHFAKLGKSDGDALSDYLQVVKDNSEYLSFKIIGIERSKTKRPIEEVVAKLHEQMLKKGALHELESGRIDLPRTIEVTVDEEDSLDAIALSEMKTSIDNFFSNRFPGGSLLIGEIASAPSNRSALLQLADIVAGAVNRRRNHDGERNFKCDFADRIIDELNLVVEEGEDDLLDSSTVLRL